MRPRTPLTLRIEEWREFFDAPAQVRQKVRIRFRTQQEAGEFARVANVEQTRIVFTKNARISVDP